MKEMINPKYFRPSYREVNFKDRPVRFYLATLEMQGVHYQVAKKKTFKTAKKARKYALRVYLRWMRLYKAAIVAMSTPEPTPEPVPTEA